MLQRHHEVAAKAIHEVDERRDDLALVTRPRPGDQDQALAFERQRLHFRRQAEILGGQAVRRRPPECGRPAAMLADPGVSSR